MVKIPVYPLREEKGEYENVINRSGMQGTREVFNFESRRTKDDESEAIKPSPDVGKSPEEEGKFDGFKDLVDEEKSSESICPFVKSLGCQDGKLFCLFLRYFDVFF